VGSRRVPEEWLGAERQRDQGVGLPKVGPQPIAKLTIDVRGPDLHQHMRASDRPAHLLAFGHALADDRIHGALREGRSDAKPCFVALPIVDDRAAIGNDIGQELGGKATEPRDGKVIDLSVGRQLIQQLLKIPDRAVDAAMPKTPLHGADATCDRRRRFRLIRPRSSHVIGDLLHGLDFHGDVKPVDDVGRGFRHRAGQPFQDIGAVRNHGDVAKAAIPFLLESMERSIT